MEQDNLASGSVTTAKIVSKNVTGLKLGDDVVSAQTLVTGVQTDHILIADASDDGNVKKALASDFTPDLTGHVVQVVNYQTGAYATGTTAIPQDDSIPQKTEGDQYLTLAITPKSATNKLKIDVVLYVINTDANPIVALFHTIDGVEQADALACGLRVTASAGYIEDIKFTHYMDAGEVVEKTFNVRAGSSAGATTYINGSGGARLLGGAIASSITITEIEV